MGRTATSRSPTSTLACADGAQPNPSARARWPTRWLWGQPRARMTRRKVLLMNGSCVVSCNVSSHQTSCVVTMSLIVVCPLDFVSHQYECVTNDRPVVSSNTYCFNRLVSMCPPEEPLKGKSPMKKNKTKKAVVLNSMLKRSGLDQHPNPPSTHLRPLV